MHQLILTRAGRNAEILANTQLRLIRSSSSSLPPTVMAELEATFDAPVIESYGMTEAAHQMTSNPMPPLDRKPGSVGLPAGPEIAIMDDVGAIQALGARGEIVIRGPNVTDGYLNNPDANATAYTRGWFRTGDQGVLDDDGYLTITGRLKEIINRGGEKISPPRGRRSAAAPPRRRPGRHLRDAPRPTRRRGRSSRSVCATARPPKSAKSAASSASASPTSKPRAGS